MSSSSIKASENSRDDDVTHKKASFTEKLGKLFSGKKKKINSYTARDDDTIFSNGSKLLESNRLSITSNNKNDVDGDTHRGCIASPRVLGEIIGYGNNNHFEENVDHLPKTHHSYFFPDSENDEIASYFSSNSKENDDRVMCDRERAKDTIEELALVVSTPNATPRSEVVSSSKGTMDLKQQIRNSSTFTTLTTADGDNEEEYGEIVFFPDDIREKTIPDFTHDSQLNNDRDTNAKLLSVACDEETESGQCSESRQIKNTNVALYESVADTNHPTNTRTQRLGNLPQHFCFDLRSELSYEEQTFTENVLESASSESRQEQISASGFICEEFQAFEKVLEADDGLRLKINEMMHMLKNVEQGHSMELRNLRDEHRHEINAALCQLDDVEQDYITKLKSSESEVKAKTSIISAVGKQLCDTTDELNFFKDENVKATILIDSLTHDLETTKEARLEAEQEVARVKINLKKLKEKEVAKKNKAVEQEQVEMRKAFNDQFGEANKKYNALENKFRSTKDDFRRVKSDFENSSKSLKNKDVEVAQIKAALAGLEAKEALRTQQHLNEVETMRQGQLDLEIQLHDLRANYSSAHSSLAVVMDAKERLSKENIELNNVCEELMSIVEGQANK